MDKQKDKLITQLKKFRKSMERKAKIERLILFGSRVTGKAKQTSDVDLLIVSKKFEGKKFFERSPEFYLRWDYDYDVDFICLTPEELERKKKQIGVISQAIREGIEI